MPVAGDDVEAFWRRHGQGLLSFAFLLTGGRAADAEDLVNTVMARLVDRGLDGIDSPVAYARRAVAHEHVSAGRRLGRQLRLVERLAVVTSPAAEPPGEDRLAVHAALRALTARERAAVVLRYYEDVPDEEAADILGCSRATIRSLIHRALPKLRARLEIEEAAR